MKPMSYTWLLTALVTLLMNWSAATGAEPEQLPVKSCALTETTSPKLSEQPDQIADLLTIPQDTRPFAAAIKAPLRADELTRAIQRFRGRYFSPWTATAPLYDTKQAVADMRSFTAKSWYGENRIRVEPERIAGLLSLAALDRFPSLKQPGITIAPTFIRALPGIRPFYETAADFPFDRLQYAELKPNEPVRILHTSSDGAWLYIESASVSGWVEPGTVRLAGETVQKRLRDAEQVVVIKDFSTLRDERGKTLPQPKIGTLYPLLQEEPDYWLVQAAGAGDGEQAALRTARIAKTDARRHPLPFASETVAQIGNELLKSPYGWGELFRNRDCSATTRDFFLPFGIWLPRNSLVQIMSGPTISLANLPNAEKLRTIREQGIPFRTILHRKGHILLYAGLVDDKPVALHNAWALRYQSKTGAEEVFPIGKTVLTTLESGKELGLTRGSTLDHLDGMLLLPVMGNPAREELPPDRGCRQ